MKQNKLFKITANKTNSQCIRLQGDNDKILLTNTNGRLAQGSMNK